MHYSYSCIWDVQRLDPRNQYKGEGKLGDKAIYNVWLSMCLEVEQVYAHSRNFWLERNRNVDNIGWKRGRACGNICVSNQSLVFIPTFNKIEMSGGG